MKTINAQSVVIKISPQSPAPVMTAAQHLADWLNQETSLNISVSTVADSRQNTFQILIGTLDQPVIREQVQEHRLPASIRHDGYILALRGDTLVIYSQVPRGVVYACGYELPKHLVVHGPELDIDIETLVEEPDDEMRGWCSWAQDYGFLAHAATQYRSNMAWMEAQVAGEVLFPAYPALKPYIQPQEAEIRQRRATTEAGIAMARSFGLETFIGGLSSIWTLPPYLMEGLIYQYPEVIATSYQGGSEWPPYEWQDRPQICPSNPLTKQFYADLVDEFLTVHHEADGIALGIGYDGYPLGCGCEQCKNYTYYNRFHDQVKLVYDIAVTRHHKKLWFWSWVVGCNSVIPGYEHYYGWLKEFAEANPESVFISSFATEADFLITHRVNPVIGTRGPHDMGMVLIWPEYRGDGVVPAWLLDWMEKNLPVLRAQGARGFIGVDTRPLNRERDLIQAAEIYALGEMTWDHNKTAEQVALEYCREKFGAAAAPTVAAALRKSSEVIAKTLFLPSGIRFSGHSHIENDLRVFWDIYTLYDSAPSFLNEEQRKQIIQAGPPYAPKVQAALPGLAFTDENIAAIIRDKDEAVTGAGWMITQAELARPDLDLGIYEQLHTRFEWLLNYARLFRGLARAFFHLRMGRRTDAEKIIAGAEEMAAALAMLPQTGLPLPYDIDAQFGGYPWMITPPQELVNALRAVGELIAYGITEQPVGVIGSEEACGALDSIYLPYDRLLDFGGDLPHYRVIVVGPAAMQDLQKHSVIVANYGQKGGKLLFYNPTENWEALPTDWLPGKVQTWVCNHPSVRVTQPEHPIVQGYQQLKSEPITRFAATSAGVHEAARYSPFIKSFVAVSNDWKTLTFPPVLAEATWGKGRIVIDLIPENRTILLRALAYLYS